MNLGFRHVFRKPGRIRRQIVEHPMHPRADGRVGVIHDECEALRVGGRPALRIHWSGGEMSRPSQEYFAGIGWPSEKAVLVIWRFIIFVGVGFVRATWP